MPEEVNIIPILNLVMSDFISPDLKGDTEAQELCNPGLSIHKQIGFF